MSDGEVVYEKVKKSKKDKKHRQVEEVEEPVIVEAVTPVKEKKEKKDKKRKTEVFEVSEPEMEEKLVKQKKDKKHKSSREAVVVEEDVSVTPEAEVSEKPKKERKHKKSKAEDVEEVAAAPPTPVASAVYTPSAKHTAASNEEWEEDWNADSVASGAKYWKRIDEDKYKEKVQGTKFAKISHFEKGGDSWGDMAAHTLSAVKGKGFTKAMQKLKRASWKGSGTIDAGVNSVQFSDWED